MTKCNLTIRLDSPDQPLRGGGKARGIVRIVSEVETRCRGLNVAMVASCDGPGGQTLTSGPGLDVFSGTLVAGQPREFPFEVEVPAWPLTYEGVRFQIRHEVRATADIPWAIDPRASIAVRVVPGDLDYSPPDQSKIFSGPSWLLKSISFLFPLVFVFNVLGPRLIAFLVVALGVLGLPFWLLFRWYPKWRIGKVDFQLQPLMLTPGEWVSGHLSIHPRGTLHAKRISVRLTATEVCESGGGDDRKIERVEIYGRDMVEAEGQALPGERATRFELMTRLPPVAAYSLRQGSNQLAWAVEASIRIFGLLRWNETRVLSVVPSRDPTVQLALRPASDAQLFEAVDDHEFEGLMLAPTGDVSEMPDDEITFEETAQQFWSARHQPETLSLLLDAVEGLPLRATAILQRPSTRGGSSGAHRSHAGELAIWAQLDAPPLPLTLFVPRDREDNFTDAMGQRWSGIAEVIGWDDAGNRLELRVH